MGGGGANQAKPTSILGGGGGYCQKYIYACVRMHMYTHTCVEYSYTMHAYTYMYTCMHSLCKLTFYILIIKASDLYEKSNKDIQVNEESFGYLYCLKAI